MNKLVLGALALGLTAPAFAQTADNNFNGFSIGAQAGVQWDKQKLETSLGNSSTTSSGFAYGGQIGWDGRIGERAVLGAEVSLTGRSGRNDFGSFDLTQGRTINATARLGFMPDPVSLVYARGGYSNARFTVDDGVARISENRDGYTVGAGYERYLSQNVSARLEYNYANYGSDNLAASLGAGSRLNYHRHAVMTGVNFRF